MLPFLFNYSNEGIEHSGLVTFEPVDRVREQILMQGPTVRCIVWLTDEEEST